MKMALGLSVLIIIRSESMRSHIKIEMETHPSIDALIAGS